MGDTELSILIKARNEASKVFKQVQDDAKGFGGSVSSALDDAKGASLALMGTVTAGAVAVGAFGVSSVNAYMDAQNAVAQLEAVLKSTGGAAGLTSQDLQEQATALQKVTKFSDEAVMATQSMLLTFTNIKGPVMQGATQAALDMAQALGMDGSQAAMQLGKALNDPAAGMAKLQRVGVTFTDQQKAAAEQMVKTGDVAGAQNLILNELSKEFGGSAVAAGKTFSGQIEILKNTFGDLQEAVGSAILNALQPLMSSFQGVVNSIGEAGGLLPWLTNIFKENQGTIAAVAGAIIGGLVPALVAMAAGAWAAIAPLLPFLAIGAALGFAINLLAQKMGGWSNLLAAVQPLLNGVIGLFRGLIGVVGAVVGFFERNHVALAALGGAITALLIPGIIAMVAGLWSMVAGLAATAVAAIAAAIPFLPLILAGAAIAAIAYLIISNWDTLKQWFNVALTAIVGWAQAAGAWISQAFSGAVEWIKGAWNGLTSAVGAVFSFIWGIIQAYINIYIAIFQGAIAVIMGIWHLITGFIQMEINGWRAIISGIIGIVSSIFSSAVGAIQSVFGGIVGFFRSVVGGIGGVFSGIINVITSPFRAAFNGIASLWNNTVGKLSFTAPSWVPGIGGKGFSMPKIPMMAEGGIVSSPTLAMIGEGRGPEAVVPLAKIGEFVRDVTGGQAGGNAVNFYGNVDLNGEAAVDRFFDRLDRVGQLASIGVPT